MMEKQLRRRDVLAMGAAAPVAGALGLSVGQDPTGPLAQPDAAERRRSSTPCSATCPTAPARVGAQDGRGGAGRLHPRDVGARPERPRGRAGVSCAAAGRVPAGCRPSLFNHSHGGGYTIGKKEFVEGRSYLQPTPYANALTDQGYVALVHRPLGLRRAERHATELDMFKAMLWRGQVLWGMMVYDSLRAVDYLLHAAGRGPARASRRSACRWAARWPGGWPRSTSASRSTVDINCLTDFDALIAAKGLDAPRHLLLRARPAEALHHGADQRADRAAARTSASSGLRDALTPLDGVDRDRPRAVRGVRRQGHAGALEAAALRRRTPGDRGRPRRHRGVPEAVAVVGRRSGRAQSLHLRP